jgi:homogentisate 1,2-dioxygenase
MAQQDNLQYQSGFGNEFASEAIKGALPIGQNSPQKPPLGLYAEQLSGSAFTAPRTHNQRTWFYRIRPSVMHKPYTPYSQPRITSTPFGPTPATPSQLRWDPLDYPAGKVDIIDGMLTMAGNGDTSSWAGMAAHRYVATASMENRFFYNADGEMLFVPENGALLFRTEMGHLHVAPGEICVIPRGVKFAVDLLDGKARGYICENYGAHFTLPDLGPIGANGLANPRDFLSPVAAYEDKEGDFTVIAKFDGGMWQSPIGHSPLDVVGWHGNYAPYKYNLKHFQAINTVSFDHPDPSIFTVLTSPSGTPGVANVDFVIFPDRWMVAEHTFRPPYFHRNLMSEFMGLIFGVYDGKEADGFNPGGCSLHNTMSAHGPDAHVVDKAENADLKPVYLSGTLAFMFESKYILRPTEAALKNGIQENYYEVWQSIPKKFKG